MGPPTGAMFQAVDGRGLARGALRRRVARAAPDARLALVALDRGPLGHDRRRPRPGRPLAESADGRGSPLRHRRPGTRARRPHARGRAPDAAAGPTLERPGRKLALCLSGVERPPPLPSLPPPAPREDLDEG